MTSMEEFFGEPISIYTRAQAIEDGVLVDVTPIAKEAGIKWPVALTRTVYSGVVEPEEYDREHCGQDAAGRLWDVLWILKVTLDRKPATDTFGYTVLVRKHGNLIRQELKCVTGPDDEGKGCFTVMLPEED